MTTFKNKDDVLTLMVHLGYLSYDESQKAVFIPNEEVRQEFVRAVKNGKHTELAELIADSDRLLQDTLEMNSDLLIGISYNVNTKKHICAIEKYEKR